jgi:hypothetical protein
VLLLWLTAPLFELGAVLMIYAGLPDLVDDVAFGSPATPMIVGCVLVVSVVGTVLARRGVSGAVRLTGAVALFVAAGVTAALGFAFATAGVLAVFTLLMVHTTVSIALIGRAVLRSSIGKRL